MYARYDGLLRLRLAGKAWETQLAVYVLAALFIARFVYLPLWQRQELRTPKRSPSSSMR